MSQTIAFARPELLWLLLLLPLYALLRARAERRRRVPFAPLQRAAAAVPLPRRGGRRGAALLGLELLLVALLVAGVAEPYRSTTIELVESEGVDVQLVLDVSLSMLAEDFSPNRLEVLRRLARELLARAGSNRLGLVIFARDAYVQSPLTTDHRALAYLLDGVDVHALDQARSGGTAIGDALVLAADQLARSRVEGRDQALVLITDGSSNDGLDPVLAARHLRQLGVRFHAIGVGGEEPVEVFFRGARVGGDAGPYLAVLDTAQLEAMVEAAAGSFYRATDESALEQIFDALSRLERAPLETRRVERRRSWAPPIAVLALALAALLWGLGAALRRPLA